MPRPRGSIGRRRRRPRAEAIEEDPPISGPDGRTPPTASPAPDAPRPRPSAAPPRERPSTGSPSAPSAADASKPSATPPAAPAATPASGAADVDVVIAERDGRVVPSTVAPHQPAPRVAPSSQVFQAGDPRVTPAVLIRPHLPDSPPPDVPEEHIGTLEFVVAESGAVEHVHLMSPANRYQERMLVAAAKTWQFQPATRDGRPVRFRTAHATWPTASARAGTGERPHRRSGRRCVAAFDSASRRQGLLGRRPAARRSADPGPMLERPHRLHAVSPRSGIPRPRRSGAQDLIRRPPWRGPPGALQGGRSCRRQSRAVGRTRGCRGGANYSLTPRLSSAVRPAAGQLIRYRLSRRWRESTAKNRIPATALVYRLPSGTTLALAAAARPATIARTRERSWSRRRHGALHRLQIREALRHDGEPGSRGASE